MNNVQNTDLDQLLQAMPAGGASDRLDNLEQNVWDNVHRGQRRLQRAGIITHAVILLNIGLMSFWVSYSTGLAEKPASSFVQNLSGDHSFAVWGDS